MMVVFCWSIGIQNIFKTKLDRLLMVVCCWLVDIRNI